ncbi:sensor histidine kinase [Actinomycetospora sp. TBRC 11914]|uniref:sensor histidine kinase n=1 Tax=Actinomycetospora sp. TBRC 11914 TaxID=2729387 RepID=UPI00145CA70B|nr:PAS domain-containing sensor histidine kinase [Actinomycetospora sp. TBRC 11914]NMO90745.1 PAS domain-containing protein [Actinomycetospora sp. TBRC 11914]
MSTLSFLLARHTALSGDEVAHLQRVASEWQLLSDLSFADFLLWVPVTTPPPDAGGSNGTTAPAAPESPTFLCVAHSRPTTAPTAHPDDMVGGTATAAQHPQLLRALGDTTMRREEQPRWHRGRSIRREVVPVGYEGRVIAVLGRDTNLAAPRVPSTLEISYLAVAGDLCQMIADGTFPTAETADEGRSTPRVGDGLVRVSAAGTVLYASPNAASAFHRLGWSDELVGADLPSVARKVSADPFEGAEVVTLLRDALAGTPSPRAEVESRGATAVVRALPLRPRGVPSGALVLVRDVTEVRRRDRALMSKDATIREIHHRVKNNLQTVAALLRLQARRTRHDEARSALTESMRRVASIALVHEALAASVDERVDIDDVLAGVVPMLNDVVRPGSGVEMRREGRAGVLPAVMATPLVMVVTELVSNALEHGFGEGASGTVRIVATRTASRLSVEIVDDGRGLPDTFSLERANGLGLQIVRTLVDSELGGTLSLRPAAEGGTRAELTLPLSHH